MEFQASDNLPGLLTRDISEKIIRNELKPGERILEAKIAKSMGVSRSPVREALRILEKNRLVELIPRKGARVTEVSAEHIEWFYDIFESLYSLVARKASQYATDTDRDDLLMALGQIEASANSGDVERYFEGIFTFAAVGMRAARNPLLENLLMDLWPSNRRFQFASLSYRKDELKINVSFFQRIYRYLLAGDRQKLEEVVKEYARNEKEFALRVAIEAGEAEQKVAIG